MAVSLFIKLKILVESIKILKNWYFYPLIHFKLVKSDHVVLETRNGIKLKIRVFSTDLIAFTHVWILEEYKKSGFEIKNDDTILDIGAHIGLFALYVSQFCKNGKIFCFEPVDENFNLLKENIKLNNIKNIIASKLAVSSKSGNVTIFLNEDESGHSMYLLGSKSVQVKSISLKEILDSNNIEKCDFIKMDCEGEEYEIINSLPEDYFEKIKKMCIEYHFAEEKPNLIKDLMNKLKTYSYSTSIRPILKDIGFLYALKK